MPFVVSSEVCRFCEVTFVPGSDERCDLRSGPWTSPSLPHVSRAVWDASVARHPSSRKVHSSP